MGEEIIKALDAEVIESQQEIDLAAGQDCTGWYTPEQIEELKAYNLKPEDIERIVDKLREALAYAVQAMSDFAAAVSRCHSRYSNYLHHQSSRRR